MLLVETNKLSRLQVEQLQKFGENVNRFGANFAVCDSKGLLILACETGRFESDWKSIFARSIEFCKEGSEIAGSRPFLVGDSVLSAVLSWDFSRPQLFAFINISQKTETACTAAKESDSQQKKLLETLSDYLSLLVEGFHFQQRSENNMQDFTRELSQVYEELVLIHKLSAGMKISDSDRDYLRMACRSLADIINVEGIAILLEGESDDSLVLAAGSGLVELDKTGKSLLLERLTAELNQGREALLDSNAYSDFKYSWPENVRSIIAVPLYGKGRSESRMSGKSEASHLIGLLTAINRLDKLDFDSADIKLFNSVATNCAVFIENGRLFKDLKELFIGSLRALTSSIDAKDQYTHGHSERVASIAKWIAERYSEREFLNQEQIYNIYIAGLLHDIGKIGISEAILCKKDKLTEDEMECIKKHPSVGADILSQIKQMRDIVPAVLYHHERVDGKGYPSRLTGRDIPLAAKIIGLADCFDAMTSKRPYRPAMGLETALDEIKNNLGTQFDEKVAMVFLNSDVYGLWETLQHKSNASFAQKEFFETGTDNLEIVKNENPDAKI